jgi:hypothetical protein
MTMMVVVVEKMTLSQIHSSFSTKENPGGTS